MFLHFLLLNVPSLTVEYLIQNGHMSEHEAKKKFCQIVKAVDYCHQHNIVHRDLKVRTTMYMYMYMH